MPYSMSMNCRSEMQLIIVACTFRSSLPPPFQIMYSVLHPPLYAAKRLPEAAQALMRLALACDRMGSKNSQCKSYLGAIVVHLYNQVGGGGGVLRESG